MPAVSIAALRELIEQRFPDATPANWRAAEAVITGVGPLDRILPGGGLPRGQLTVWTPQGGACAMLRAARRCTVANSERAVWIGTAGTVVGAFWEEGPFLVQPKSRKDALKGAEELLRCGGFALVVLDGTEPEGTETVRLTRAVREGGGAFVAITPHPSLAKLRVESKILPHSYQWRRGPFDDPVDVQTATIRVRARAAGWNASADITVPVTPHDVRLSLEPGLADRRGLPRWPLPRPPHGHATRGRGGAARRVGVGGRPRPRRGARRARGARGVEGPGPVERPRGGRRRPGRRRDRRRHGDRA